MVLYFSGTGNSQFVAERIAFATGDKAVDIKNYMKGTEKPDFKEGGVYVFVAPTYVAATARAMTDFIYETKFPKGIKAYYVLTCKASMGVSPEVSRRLSGRKGFKFMGAAEVKMPQNYLVYFTTEEKEANREVIEEAIPEIDKIAETIKAGEKFQNPKPKFMEYPFIIFTADLYYEFFMKTKKFCVSENCISCQKCVNLCPYNNIKLVDGKPVWGDKCTHCMACINMCPTEAINFGKGTIDKPRYKGPYETLKS